MMYDNQMSGQDAASYEEVFQYYSCLRDYVLYISIRSSFSGPIVITFQVSFDAVMIGDKGAAAVIDSTFDVIFLVVAGSHLYNSLTLT